MDGKIYPLDKLPCLRGYMVLACGCFDLIHIGHCRHLAAAKAMGDTLIVVVTPDRFVNKGPHRPAFGENLRAELLAALECVDFVAINQWPTAVEAIKMIRPAIFVKGQEYVGKETPALIEEREAIRSVGGVLAFTQTEEWHSTDLLATIASQK